MKYKPSGVVILDLTPEGNKLLKILDKEELNAILLLYSDTGWELEHAWLTHVLRDGYIELVRLPGVGELWIDEEGKLKNLPINEIATTLFQICNGPYDVIVGTAVLILDPIHIPPDKVSSWIAENTRTADQKGDKPEPPMV